MIFFNLIRIFAYTSSLKGEKSLFVVKKERLLTI